MENLTCLAEGYVFPTDLNVTGINANEMVVGPTRCGKTASVVESKLLHTYNGSLVVSLTKRALVNRYGPVFQKRGYEVWDLNLAEPRLGNVVYDPMDFVENERDIMQLAKTIVEGEQDGLMDRDRYWVESGTSGIAAILNLAYLKKKSVGERASFKDFFDLYARLKLESRKGGDSCCTTLDEEFEWADERYPGNQACRLWKTISGNAHRTANCIYSIMNNAMDKLINKEILEAMGSRKKRVSFEELGSKNVVLFVTTSPVNKSQQKLATMFFSDAFRTLFEYAEKCPGRELPVPVHLVCDDFACGSVIPDFDEYISVFCAKGISTTLLLQSESQLEQMYGKHAATTIINNCDTYLYMGGMDDVTCYNISRRRNVPVEEVYSMPLEQVVLFRRGSKPVVARRYQTYEDPEYKEMMERRRSRRSSVKEPVNGKEEVMKQKENGLVCA